MTKSKGGGRALGQISKNRLVELHFQRAFFMSLKRQSAFGNMYFVSPEITALDCVKLFEIVSKSSLNVKMVQNRRNFNNYIQYMGKCDPCTGLVGLGGK